MHKRAMTREQGDSKSIIDFVITKTEDETAQILINNTYFKKVLGCNSI